MGSVQNLNFPQWVNDMINAEFVTGKGKDPNHRGYFCVDCGGKSLRKIDVETQHKDHNVLQALTCSREYGYNLYDVLKIPDLLDVVNGVCPYKVNTGFVYFPKSRKKNDKKSKSVVCVVCGADLSKNALPERDRFCSILCKLNSGFGSYHSRMLQENAICFSEKSCSEKPQKILKLKIKLGVGISVACEKGKKRSFQDVAKDGNQQENKRQKIDDVVGVRLSLRKKSRKGIPYRAPLFWLSMKINLIDN